MNNAILRFVPEVLDNVPLLPYILISNDIRFIAEKRHYTATEKVIYIDIRVSSPIHFKEGFGIYWIQFNKDIEGWVTLKEIKLEELL